MILVCWNPCLNWKYMHDMLFLVLVYYSCECNVKGAYVVRKVEEFDAQSSQSGLSLFLSPSGQSFIIFGIQSSQSGLQYLAVFHFGWYSLFGIQFQQPISVPDWHLLFTIYSLAS